MAHPPHTGLLVRRQRRPRRQHLLALAAVIRQPLVLRLHVLLQVVLVDERLRAQVAGEALFLECKRYKVSEIVLFFVAGS